MNSPSFQQANSKGCHWFRLGGGKRTAEVFPGIALPERDSRWHERSTCDLESVEQLVE